MFSRSLDQVRKSAGLRLVFWYSTIFVFSSALIFTLAYLVLSSSLHAKDRESIRTKIEEYTFQFRTGGRDAVIKEMELEKPLNEKDGLVVRLATTGGRTLFFSSPPNLMDFNEKDLLLPPLGREDSWSEVQGEEDEDGLVVASRLLSDGTVLQVGMSTANLNELLENFRATFALIMIPVVLIGFVGGSLLAFRILRPVRDLIQTVRSIDMGRMDVRVPVSPRSDELGELVQLFNDMLGKIQTLIAGMREALDNVAHDLRTPLSRMRGVIEAVLQTDCHGDRLREALMDCAEESERIAVMLNTLMDISEAETGVMQLHPELTDIALLVKDVAEIYQVVAEDKELTLLVQVAEPLEALVDPVRIRQVVANLLDNALKYTSPNGTVEIDAFAREGEVIVRVGDNGPGIDAGDLPRIFDRLYRGDKSRSQRGLGLGLSLVQAVAHAHKGRVEVVSRPGEGTQFSLHLPSIPSAVF